MDARLNLYPNPMNGKAQLEIILVEKTNMTIELFDMQGNLVQTLFQGNLNTGKTTIEVNAKELAPGVYFTKATSVYGVNVIRTIVSE